jgi:hypothetical protein
MLSLTLKNAADREYSFDITPKIVIEHSLVRKEDSNVRLEDLVTWEIDGYLAPLGRKSMLDQQEDLIEFLDTDYLKSAILSDDNDNTIEELVGADKVKIASLSFPEGSGPQHATRRNYTISLSGRVLPNVSDSVGIYEFSIDYSVETSTIATRTITGTVKDFVNNMVLAKYAALKISMGWMTWTGANLVSETFSDNEASTVCNFTIQQKKYWVANPTNLTSADVTIEKSVDAMGVVKRKLSGSYVGSEADCTTALTALVAGMTVISTSVSRNDFSNTTSFNVMTLGTASDHGDEYYSIETLSITESLTGKVFKPVLGGGAPVLQTVGYKTARATQSGTIKRLSTWPSPPSLHWPIGNLIDASQVRQPLEHPDANTGYVIQYTNQFEFVTTPSF